MRCQVCDYAEGGLPSEYNEGLQDSKALRRVRYNKETGDSVCDHCAVEIRELNEAWRVEDEEEE